MSTRSFSSESSFSSNSSCCSNNSFTVSYTCPSLRQHAAAVKRARASPNADSSSTLSLEDQQLAHNKIRFSSLPSNVREDIPLESLVSQVEQIQTRRNMLNELRREKEREMATRRSTDEIHHLKGLVTAAVLFQKEKTEKDSTTASTGTTENTDVISPRRHKKLNRRAGKVQQQNQSFTARIMQSAAEAAKVNGRDTLVSTEKAADYEFIIKSLFGDIDIFAPQLGYKGTLTAITSLGLWH